MPNDTAVDSAFIAVMYTSENDRPMRYTDEGETMELCKWTVDLSSLPAFRQGVQSGGGFYTGERLPVLWCLRKR